MTDPPGPEPTMIALPANIDAGLSPHFGDGVGPPALHQHADDSTLGQRVPLGRFDFGVGVTARLDVPRPGDACQPTRFALPPYSGTEYIPSMA